MSSVFNLGFTALAELSGTGWILFTTRALRMFAYGSTGVILALYLSAVGLPDQKIGMLMTGTLIGDAAISLAISLAADRIGRRLSLLIGCALKVLGGVVFAYVSGPNFWLLLFAATVGVISPTGNEVGPFQALEQSMLSDQIPGSQRTSLFAWYNLLGYSTTAVGSLTTGFATGYIVDHYRISRLDSYRIIFFEYGCIATLIAFVTLCLTHTVESVAWIEAHEEQKRRKAAGRTYDVAASADAEQATPLLDGNAADPAAVERKPSGMFGLSKKSRGIVTKLSLLFSMDSFGGGLVQGAFIAYYFHIKYGVDDAYLGGLLFGANIIAGISSLAAGWVAHKVGLINTMVLTHLPSNVLLALVPLMPNLGWATVMLFLRFSISQMDVAPRQSYVSGVVPAEERTAAMGITNIVKSLGAALGPTVTGYLAANNMFDWAFFLAGGIKALYDLLLLWSFSHHKAEHETVGTTTTATATAATTATATASTTNETAKS